MSKESKLIRQTSHTIRFANSGKRNILADFRKEYAAVVSWTIDYLWNNRLEFEKGTLDIQNGELYSPSFISTVGLDIPTRLSGRAVKAATTQACGVVRSQINSYLHSKHIVDWCASKGLKPNKKDVKRVAAGLVKPNCESVHPEIDTNNVKIEQGENSFDLWLNFGAMFADSRGLQFAVPIKMHRKSREWESKGRLMSGLSLGKKAVHLRWEAEVPSQRDTGSVIAIDQGITDLLTVSNGQKFEDDIHGHTFSGILKKIVLKKDGSKAHRQACEHRRNHINWFVKRLDLSGVSEVKYENIENIFFGKKRVNPFRKGFTATLIESALTNHCLANGVRLTFVENAYNSQRCAKCGWTQAANRKGKSFLCLHCKHKDDADRNATQNILIRETLHELPIEFRWTKPSIQGFFWNLEYIADSNGVDLTVPPTNKNQTLIFLDV